jgi:hypothetical protein
MNNNNHSGKKLCMCGCKEPVNETNWFRPGHLDRLLKDWHRRYEKPFCNGCGEFPHETVILCRRCYERRLKVAEVRNKWYSSSESPDPSETSAQTDPPLNDAPFPIPDPWKPSSPGDEGEDPDEPDDDEDPNDESVEDDETILQKM